MNKHTEKDLSFGVSHITGFGIVERPEVLPESKVSEKYSDPNPDLGLGALLLRMQNRASHARHEEDGISVRYLAGVFIVVGSPARTRNPSHQSVDPEYSMRSFYRAQEKREKRKERGCGGLSEV